MINKKFEAYKVEREIKRSGKEFVFKRPVANEFGEPTELFEDDTITVNGLYHETNSYVQITSGDTTETRTKKQPMILCLFAETTGLKVGDVTVINGKDATISGVINVQEWNIISDISMEYFDNGL